MVIIPPPPGSGPTADGSSPWRRRLGRLLAVGLPAVAVSSLLTAGLGIVGQRLAITWQLIDLDVLADDPGGSLWYLHIQPPLQNLVVGLVAWLPLPLAGTLFVLLAGTLVATSVLLAGVLRRWGLGPVAAGALAGAGSISPVLLRTIELGGYEAPVALLVVAALAAAQRHLDDPSRGWLVAASVALTLGALTRSLLHPLWVAAVLALLVAARPVPRRHVALAAAVPLVLLGGWALKNDVVFGTPTLSSWSGFNLQRGVVATMGRDQVRAAVADGDVSPLALERPWRNLDRYAHLVPPCRPRHDHPAVAEPQRTVSVNGRSDVPNLNHECFLPVYAQASEDARALVARYPTRYLATRRFSLTVAYDMAAPCAQRPCTWVEAAVDPLLLPLSTEIPVDDWNLPLFVVRDPLAVRVSLTLVAASLFVVARTGVAARRLHRVGWLGRATWPTPEVLWLIVGGTLLLVVAGAALIEFGENARFRSSLDPLLVALPAASAIRAVSRRPDAKLRG